MWDVTSSWCRAAMRARPSISSAEHVGTNRGVMTGCGAGPRGAHSLQTPLLGSTSAPLPPLSASESIPSTKRSVSASESAVVSQYDSGAFRSMFTLPTKARWPMPEAIRPSCSAASVWIVAKYMHDVVPFRSVRATAFRQTRAAKAASLNLASEGKVYLLSQSSSWRSYPIPVNENCGACVCVSTSPGQRKPRAGRSRMTQPRLSTTSPPSRSTRLLPG
mmetsp:Transcript_33977/g.109092  ORF Transcript_33977/g.109092 Transcript_33977/m.109092 type:complete len:219 (-) Transcript_33977:241-897(-)